MKFKLLPFCLLLAVGALFSQTSDFFELPEYISTSSFENKDWLVHSIHTETQIFRENEKDIVMSNGLLLRRWRISPNLTTTHLTLLTTGESFLQSLSPEGMLILDGDSLAIGGLSRQAKYAYLNPESIDTLRSNAGAFQFDHFETGEIKPLTDWKQTRRVGQPNYPPKGKRLDFFFKHPDRKWQGVTVVVHYEMYDGIPLICKWLSVHSEGRSRLKINSFTSEILAFCEEGYSMDHSDDNASPNIFVKTNYNFQERLSRFPNQAVSWQYSSTFPHSDHFFSTSPNLLCVKPPFGPDVTLLPGDELETFRTWELFHDSYDRERGGLTKRRFYRLIAPWATENPISLYLADGDPEVIRHAVDQCAELGFEMLILTFGSGIDMEDLSDENIEKFRQLAKYAHSKGIGIGGCSLFFSRQTDNEDDYIEPADLITSNKLPCIGSKRGIRYFDYLKKFLSATGFDFLELDGSYWGYLCNSESHPGHESGSDSQWQQWSMTDEFYQWLRQEGVYFTADNGYFTSGCNKMAIGYWQSNEPLPDELQIILDRQNIFDGTWEINPSMGWISSPLTEYSRAALGLPAVSPKDFRSLIWQSFGAGVQNQIPGSFLFGSTEVKYIAEDALRWYKDYRDILNSDIIHLRRPDGQDWDGILHANPALREKALAMLFNPLKENILRKIKLPLYYSGLTDKASVRIGSSDSLNLDESASVSYPLNRFFEIEIEVKIPAEGWIWIVVE